MPDRPRESLASVVSAAALAASLLPFAALAVFAWPQNDDWAFAQRTLQYGYLRANAHWWLNWIGRYTSTALLSANPIVLGAPGACGAVSIALLVGLVAAAVALVSALAPPATPRAGRLAAALGLTAVVLSGMPSLAEGLYWLSGGVTYLLGTVLLGLLAAALVRRGRAASEARPPWTLASAALVTAVIGTNELAALYALALLGLSAAWTWYRDRRLDPGLVRLVVLAGLLFTTTVVAPGARHRIAVTVRPGLAPALLAAALDSLRWTWAWLARTPLLPLVLLLLPAFARAARHEGPPAVHPALASSLLAAAVLGSMITAGYGGGVVEPRTVNASFAVFAAGFVWCAFTGVVHLVRRGRLGVVHLPTPVRLAAQVAFAALLATGNLGSAIGDLASGRAARFAAAQRERTALIRACPTPVCTVPALQEAPRSLSFFDDAVDPGADAFWLAYNQDNYAWCHGKHRVEKAR